MPNDGKPEHQLPFTPYGLQTYKSHKALEGADAVLPGFYNDPRDKCEPLGFPRANFYNLRETQIMQNEYKVAILYEYGETWRVDLDGWARASQSGGWRRARGKEIREPRFYGYSVGKWEDDSTLVVQTVGMMPEDRVWLDSTGRPISDALRVEERFHRVNHDRLELTVTINDPKMYTKPGSPWTSFRCSSRIPTKTSWRCTALRLRWRDTINYSAILRVRQAAMHLGDSLRPCAPASRSIPRPRL